MNCPEAFACVDINGNLLTTDGVTSVTRGTGAIPPQSYILTLAREVVPTRAHVTLGCRSVTTPPPSRHTVKFIDGKTVCITWLGADGAPCETPFTVKIEGF
jgi:hypothetical protein